MIERASREALVEQAERDAVEDRYWSVLKVLGQKIDRCLKASGSGGFRSIIEQES